MHAMLLRSHRHDQRHLTGLRDEGGGSGWEGKMAAVRRLRRILLNALTPLSLLLCVATCVLWRRSYSMGDHIWFYHEPKLVEAFSRDGLLQVSSGTLWSSDYPHPSGWYGTVWPFSRETEYVNVDLRKGTTFGFRLQRWQQRSPTFNRHAIILTLPYCLPAICFGLHPGFGVWKWLRARRGRKNGDLCPRCRYDLTGNVSGVCPECGTKVAS
jgi:hypothetical protein